MPFCHVKIILYISRSSITLQYPYQLAMEETILNPLVKPIATASIIFSHHDTYHLVVYYAPDKQADYMRIVECHTHNSYMYDVGQQRDQSTP